jgi:hypothetical protein
MDTLIPWTILVVGLFEILQIIDVMVRDLYHFDNHTHKLAILSGRFGTIDGSA